MAGAFGVSIDFLVTGKAASDPDREAFNRLLLERVAVTDSRLEDRRVRPFSRQELAVLFAAMLMDP